MASQETSGKLVGKRVDGVIQYLGIKYAVLQNQFSAPEVVGLHDEVANTGRYGPRAPAIDASLFEKEHLIQQVIDDAPSPPISGTECLNLNIYTPDNSTTTGEKKLPVMVFIHGGGFIMGGNAVPYWNPARLVKMSVEEGLPLIIVSINDASYRLAVLGNLTAGEMRAKGYPGNNSLRDQRSAFQWVKSHISGFGGDSDNITAFGVSAGSVAILTHLFSEKPLFKRAIAMSGTPIMLKPLTQSAAEVTYETMISHLGLKSISQEERIQRLISIEPEELVDKTPVTAQLTPFIDGELVPVAMTFQGLKNETVMSGQKWCEELMIGDCQHDGNVYIFMGLAQRSKDLASTLYISFRRTLGYYTATAVLEAYHIKPDTPDERALEAAIVLGSAIMYHSPTLAFANAFAGKTYVYQFNMPNPWKGQFKGLSTHYLDAAFLFQNFNERLPSAAVEVAKTLARDFVAYANGIKPWQEYDRRERKVKCFGPSEVTVKGNHGWGNGRSDGLNSLVESGKVDMDELNAAWNEFLAGR